MVELRGLTKKYKKDNLVLNNLNICFSEKSLYFLTGKSGSGKSTLLNILSGIDFNYEGEMLIDGKDFKTFSNKDINYYRGTYVGYVFQDYNLIKDLTVFENLKLACDISKIDYSEIDVVLEKLNISHLKNKKSNEISGGEAQRVAIARCLIKHPKVILADEPTGALDNENGDNIMDVLASLASEYTVIVVTHNTAYLDRYDSHNYSIENGNVKTDVPVNSDQIDSFVSGRTNRLSTGLVLKFSKKTILVKRNGLVLSLLFIIISVLLLSVSLSGITYNPYYSAYEALLSYDDFIVSRNGRRGSFESTKMFSTDYLNELESTIDDKFVYGYQYETISLDGSDSLREYYRGSTKGDYYDTDGLAFEYNKNTIDLFDLKVVAGNDPVLDNECAITDTLADTFIEVNYRYSDIEKGINTYDDLIGLDLFGYKICSVVSCKKSQEYKNGFEINRKTRDARFRMDDSIYCGCANSIFISTNLLKSSKTLVAYSRSGETYSEDEVYGSGVIKEKRDNSSSDIEFFNDYTKNDSGVIVGADVFLGNGTYHRLIEDLYNSYKKLHDDWDEDKLQKESTDFARSYAIGEVINKTMNFRITPSLDDDFVDYKNLNIIGVDFTNLLNMYVDDGLFDEDINYISNLVSVGTIFHDATNNKSCREYAYKLMKSYMNWEGDDAYFASTVVQDYLDYGDVFKILGYVFMALSIISLSIGVFITYKHINSSIIKVEKDFGVLKSMGVTSFDIFRILNVQNIIISVSAIIFGCLLQYVGVYLMNKITSNVLRFDCFFSTYSIAFWNYLAIIFVALIVPVLVSVKSSIKCSRRSPKDILNNN